MYGLLLCLVALLECQAQTAPAPTNAAQKPHTHTGSPFSSFTKSLSQEKKKPFMELMKRLRSAKVATGSKEDKKKSMTGLDVEIHKLLGSEYKRYRSVQAASKAEHAAKKGSSSGAQAAPQPPQPAVAPASSSTASGSSKKKKPSSSGLPGASSKGGSSKGGSSKKKKPSSSSTTIS